MSVVRGTINFPDVPVGDFLTDDGTFAPGGGVTDGDKGDIVVSGSGTSWIIDTQVVTYDKLQLSTDTNILLGRITPGAGPIEEIPFTDAGYDLLSDVDADAQRTTLGLGTMAVQNASSVVITGGSTVVDNSGFEILDTGGDHKLKIRPAEDLTANRTLSLTLNDADRSLILTGDATISGTNTGDQVFDGFTYVFKATSEFRDSSNTGSTLTNDSILQFSMAINAEYSIRIVVCFSASGNGDFKYALTGPASPVVVASRKTFIASGNAFAAEFESAYTSVTPVLSTGQTGFITYDMVVFNGSNAGTFAFQWAQNTSHADDSAVYAGSYLAYKRVD